MSNGMEGATTADFVAARLDDKVKPGRYTASGLERLEAEVNSKLEGLQRRLTAAENAIPALRLDRSSDVKAENGSGTYSSGNPREDFMRSQLLRLEKEKGEMAATIADLLEKLEVTQAALKTAGQYVNKKSHEITSMSADAKLGALVRKMPFNGYLSVCPYGKLHAMGTGDMQSVRPWIEETENFLRESE